MTIKAQLFITCLAEQFFSPMLKDMVTVLERLGVQCEFPEAQTCCGQPMFNSGFQSQARDLARKWIDVFDRTDGYIVSPSGSCVDMVHHHYPELFPAGTADHERAKSVAARTFEFTQFLVDELKITDVGAVFPHKVTYHASCHLLRGLHGRTQPKQLLQGVTGLELVPLNEEETCCGFGGVFSVIYPEVSQVDDGSQGAQHRSQRRGHHRRLRCGLLDEHRGRVEESEFADQGAASDSSTGAQG